MEGVWLGLIFKENYNLLGGKTKTSYIISQPIVIVYFSATGALTRCIRIVLGVNLSDFVVVAENIVILFLPI
jgi:hypothetical protein